MKEKINKYIKLLLRKNIKSQFVVQDEAINNNANIKLKQFNVFVAVFLTLALIAGYGVFFIKDKAESKTQKIVEEPVLTLELADKNLDPEKHWRNYFEERQEVYVKDIEKRLQELAKAQEKALNQANIRIEEELASTKEKLSMAQAELVSASLDLKKAASRGEAYAQEDRYIDSDIGVQDFVQDVEFDQPKSAKNYIPEGTYFTGHLLGGIAVSTALNTPDENATPVAIKLIGRFDVRGNETTNLSPLNKLQLQNCRIMGSSYGDLSSERAIIRLEKMVCEQDGVYVTSKIAGQLFGSDGLNGIKGTVVSTSSKHIKNAAIGGLISGISSAAKGQDASTISGSGIISTKRKGAKTLLGEGAIAGTSNAGEKIAEYYLRQAEAMSPILTVPSGVRVNAQITKGFFVGEVSTHRKIKQARSENKDIKSDSDNNRDTKSEYME